MANLVQIALSCKPDQQLNCSKRLPVSNREDTFSSIAMIFLVS